MAKRIQELPNFAVNMAPQIIERLAEENRRPIAPAPGRPQFHEWPKVGLHAAWIGHSTVYLSIDGFTIVTDPVFSSKIGINFGAMTVGLKRLIEPAAQISAFPHPDLVLLSHAHMDHLDIPSLRRLAHNRTQLITAASTRDLIPRSCHWGGIQELKWGESAQVGPASVQAFEVRHWGARMRTDTHRGYNGYMLEIGRFRLVFGGDTAYTDTFRQLRASRAVDLAIMPIGAYNPWIQAHCNPEQALAMADQTGADFVLPVHHRTFELGREARGEPMERLLRAAGATPDRIVCRDIAAEFQRF
jgi:L-ascorbate metabolism protein UlaG (beta-lactamase superfamily)